MALSIPVVSMSVFKVGFESLIETEMSEEAVGRSRALADLSVG
jgi:hypothetical protein